MSDFFLHQVAYVSFALNMYFECIWHIDKYSLQNSQSLSLPLLFATEYFATL